jgi:hypothetical protein
MLIFILILLVVIAIGSLFVKLATKVIEVEDDRYRTCFLAVFAAFFLAAIPSMLGFQYAWIASVIISVFLYAKILKANLLRAAGVYLLSTIIPWAIVAVLAMTLAPVAMKKMLDPSFFGLTTNLESMEEAPQEIRDFILAADDVCRCGTDQACAMEKMSALEPLGKKIKKDQLPEQQQQMLAAFALRAGQCMTDPQPYEAPVGIEAWRTPKKTRLGTSSTKRYADISPAPSRAPVPQQKVQKSKPAAARYGFAIILPSDLDAHIRNRVRIQVSNGPLRVGYLNKISEKSISVQSLKNRGLTYEIDFEDIQRIEAWMKLKHSG